MKAKTSFFIIGAFVLGIVVTMAFTSVIPEKKTASQTTTFVLESEKTMKQDDNSNIITRILGMTNDAKASPADRIAEENIHVDKAKILINIPNAEWARFTDTHSMDPVLSSTANAIEIVPKDASEIHLGDIVSYQSEYADGIIIHRVIETGIDDKGWYCIMKGDNNPNADPGRIRFSQVRRLVVAIIY